MVGVTTERDEADLQRVETLGSVRLHREHTHEVILIPTPSDDPNDPLNWYDPVPHNAKISPALTLSSGLQPIAITWPPSFASR